MPRLQNPDLAFVANKVISQGGQLVHNAAKAITPDQTNFINSGSFPSLKPILELPQNHPFTPRKYNGLSTDIPSSFFSSRHLRRPRQRHRRRQCPCIQDARHLPRGRQHLPARRLGPGAASHVLAERGPGGAVRRPAGRRLTVRRGEELAAAAVAASARSRSGYDYGDVCIGFWEALDACTCGSCTTRTYGCLSCSWSVRLGE